MSDILSEIVKNASPLSLIICLILLIIYSLIKVGRLRGQIIFGENEKKKQKK